MNKDYSPSELLAACMVEATICSNPVYTEKDPDELKERLIQVIKRISKVSVGAALRHLNELAATGKEYSGGCDGLDALCHHLDIHTVQRAIIALDRVSQRFG